MRILVCNETFRCNDKAFEFYRPIVVGPDPVAILDPRPETFVQDYSFNGFTFYTLWNGADAIPPFNDYSGTLITVPIYLTDDTGNILTDDQGNPIVIGTQQVPGESVAKQAVLAEVAELSGVATPQVTDFSMLLAHGSVAQTLLAANASRNWVLIYNPSNQPLAISEGVARMGGRSSNQLGYGEAMFWASAQGEGVPYGGAMSWVGPWTGQPVWVWENTTAIFLTDDSGNILTDDQGNPLTAN